MALAWVFIYFGIKGSINFFAQRVVNELHWSANLVSIGVLTSTLAGIMIIWMNGRLLDKMTRKGATALIIGVGATASIVAFLSTNTVLVLAFNIIAVGFLNSFLIIGSTWTNELFPTEIRGNAMAWSNNIIGRLGQVLVPVLIGTLSLSMTLGHAIAIAMVLPFISLVLIAVFLPAAGKYRDSDETPRPSAPYQKNH
jgi:putative MFS transporter